MNEQEDREMTDEVVARAEQLVAEGKADAPLPAGETERPFADAPPPSVRRNPRADAEVRALHRAAVEASKPKYRLMPGGVGQAAIMSAITRAGLTGKVTTRRGDDGTLEVWAAVNP